MVLPAEATAPADATGTSASRKPQKSKFQGDQRDAKPRAEAGQSAPAEQDDQSKQLPVNSTGSPPGETRTAGLHQITVLMLWLLGCRVRRVRHSRVPGRMQRRFLVRLRMRRLLNPPLLTGLPAQHSDKKMPLRDPVTLRTCRRWHSQAEALRTWRTRIASSYPRTASRTGTAHLRRLAYIQRPLTPTRNSPWGNACSSCPGVHLRCAFSEHSVSTLETRHARL